MVLPLPILEFAGSVNSAISSSLVMLVNSGFRWKNLDLVRQGVHVNRSIIKCNVSLLSDPSQCVLEPVLVIPFCMILAGVSTAAFLPVVRRFDTHHGLR